MEDTELEKTYKGLDLGENFTIAKESLKKFKEVIDGLKSMKAKQEAFLKIYFDKLRDEINAEREFSKTIVDEHYAGLIRQVNMIEEEKKMCQISELPWEEGFNNLKQEINIPKIDIKRWDKVASEANSEATELRKVLSEISNEVLDSSYSYVSNNELARCLEPVKIVIKPKRLHVIKFTKSGFKAFQTSNQKEVLSRKYILNNATWCVGLRNAKKGYLGCYLFRCTNKNQKDIRASYRIQLNNKKPWDYAIMDFDYKFAWNADDGMGSIDFMSYKEIFEGGFYDQVNDSISFTIHIEFK